MAGAGAPNAVSGAAALGGCELGITTSGGATVAGRGVSNVGGGGMGGGEMRGGGRLTCTSGCRGVTTGGRAMKAHTVNT